MPRQTDKLTALSVKNEKRVGRYGDGNGLWLQVQSADRKSWLFRYSFEKKPREMGLGPYPRVSLAEAREKARQQRNILRQGIDPLAERRPVLSNATVRALCFRDAAEALIGDKRSGWRNAKHTAQWTSTLARYAYPTIGPKLARDVTLEDVLTILRPLWVAKHETASRLRGRLEDVLWSAAVKEQRQAGYHNPAVWKGNLQHILPSPRTVRRVDPHAALPWERAPQFMAQLGQAAGIGARALEWTILTAARSNMVIGATWGEVDEGERVWAIPWSRMKGGEDVRIPLSEPALAILDAVRPLRRPDHGDFLFPGIKHGQSISNMTMAKVLDRLGVHADVHGFRSTFRDWAGEATSHPPDAAEAPLDHQLPGGKTRSAYQRGDLFKKRVALMADWGQYLIPLQQEV
jgi:integrase